MGLGLCKAPLLSTKSGLNEIAKLKIYMEMSSSGQDSDFPER